MKRNNDDCDYYEKWWMPSYGDLFRAFVLGLLFGLLLIGAQSLFAAEIHADYIEGEKSAELITPEVRSAASLLMGNATVASQFLHAMQLNMTKYDMDMRTDSGRRAWHGRMIREVVDTNALTKVQVYSNDVTGAIWKYRMPFKPVGVKVYPSQRVAHTNGVPSRLAEARIRRAAEVNNGPVTTNITIEANAPAGGGK